MDLFESEPRIGYEVLKSLVRVLGSKILNIEQAIVQGKTKEVLGQGGVPLKRIQLSGLR